MNKILRLFDEDFVLDYLRRKLLPIYRDYSGIEKVRIRPHKKMIWDHTYHVVVEFEVFFVGGDKVSVFGTAHSEELRSELYKNLKFLEEKGFDGADGLLIPRPLFYSKGFNCFFYQGIAGENLHHYIKKNDFAVIEKFLPRVALWFAKLHDIPYQESKSLNEAGSRISSVVPGVEHILSKVREGYPELIGDVSHIFGELIKKEEYFFAHIKRRWVIHGDAHPENIIVVNGDIGVIDFSDLCWSDFARDIGTFLEQLGYMMSKRTEDKAMIKKMEDIFLENYLKSANIELDDHLLSRIGLYQHWTIMRMVTVFLLRENPNPEKAIVLIDKVKKYLGA